MNIFDLIPKDIFIHDIEKPEHYAYITSGNYYEHYFEIAKKYKPKSILEIGTRYGYSLCSMVAGSIDTVEYVEGWDNGSYINEPNPLDIAKINLIDRLQYKGEYVFKNINSHSVKSLDRNFDVVHVDGDHGFYGKLQDYNLVKNNCKVMIVDDYDSIGEVKGATNEFLATNKEIIRDWHIIKSVTGTFIIEFK